MSMRLRVLVVLIVLRVRHRRVFVSVAATTPLGDTNRTFVVYKQKPTDFQCDHLLTATQTNTKLRVARQWPG